MHFHRAHVSLGRTLLKTHLPRVIATSISLAATVTGAMLLVACKPAATPPTAAAKTEPSAQSQSFYASDFSKMPAVPAMTELGRMLFSDPALSGSGSMSCASCHDPQAAFGPSNASAVQLGGIDGRTAGTRAVPSLRYVQNVAPFTEHHFDEAVDESVDQGPAGGHTWDGRADTIHDQARLPLLSPLEMANSSPSDIVTKVQRASYADRFRDTFGDDVFNDEQRAFRAVLMVLEVFQQSPQDFYPYTSKYDAWLRGQAQLTEAEARGLAAFNDPEKGNCAACHPSAIQNGSFPQFTDYGFIAVGVPRNSAIPANAKADYFDLGLCGPLRTDLTEHPEYCGLFRTPSLRNVALRHTFFHNGVFDSLERVVEFYAQRDTHPEKFYSKGSDRKARKFDDLPRQHWRNVNVDAPFRGHPDGKASLSEQEIADVVAFLGTLTDGYRP